MRLKGGDPSVFGRLEEELEALAAAGIECEVVPGVTAALAAAADHAAAADAPRHRPQRRADDGDDPRRRARSPAATPTPRSFYMAGKQLAALSRRLVDAGWPAETPALVVSRAGWPDQLASEHRVATLGDATRAAFGPPDGRHRRRRRAAVAIARPTLPRPLRRRASAPPSTATARPRRKIRGFAVLSAAESARLPELRAMTHVVLESCIRCKYTDCVDVCPVDCFREGPNFLTIDPDECIDCAVCIPECPVNAIVPEEDVPGDQQHMIQAQRRARQGLAGITRAQARAARRRRVERQDRQARPS